MAENCDNHEARLKVLEATTAQTRESVEEIRRALLGDPEWGQRGMVAEMSEIKSNQRALLETKNRAVWLLVALATIAGAFGSIATWLVGLFTHRAALIVAGFILFGLLAVGCTTIANRRDLYSPQHTTIYLDR